MGIYLFIVLCYSLLLNTLLYGKSITITNKDEKFLNIQDIINNNQDEELILNFSDCYYNMDELIFSNNVSTLTNITFIGNNNGTVFDYNEDIRGTFMFKFNNSKKKYVTYKNIIFKNFTGTKSGISIVRADLSNNDFLIFENCTFQNNALDSINVFMSCTQPSHNEPNFIFNNCNF